MKKEKQSLKKVLFLIPILIGIVGGVFLGHMMVKIDEANGSFLGEAEMGIISLSMLIGLLFHVITHEAGHLIFGVLSGYRFISFRIGSFTLVRVGKEWRMKRFSIPGTAGQCLLAPPPKDESGNYPFRLYNFGGVCINLVTSLLFTLLACIIKENELLRIIFVIEAGLGYFMAASNGIPLKISGIANDGYNAFSMRAGTSGLNSFYQQLDLNARLSDGERLKDLPYESVQVEDGAKLTNPLTSSAKLFEYYWYADQGRWEEAKQVIQEFDGVKDKLIPLLWNMITVEKVYLELIGENRQYVIDELCTKEFCNYMKRAKYDVHVKRVQYGLELRSNSDSKRIQKAKEALLKVVKNSPVEGEALMSLALSKTMETVLEKN